MPASLKYVGALFKSTWKHVKQSYWTYLGFIAVAVIISIFLMPHDRELLDAIRKDPQVFPEIHDFAGKISYYTMFTFTPLLLCTVIWTFGWLSKKVHFKKVAMICLVSGAVAGICVTFLRPGLGRARPRANMEDKFYFLEMKSDMQSYPSGHVMSNVAGAAALTIVEPWIGVPYLILSSSTAWSRMQRNAHYPTDVTVGAIFGIAIGLAFAQGARLMKKDEDPLEKE